MELEKVELSSDAYIGNELKKFEVDEAALIAIAKKYESLTVTDVNDKEGLKKVRMARLELKEVRVDISKKSKNLRDSAVRFQKAVIGREKELVAIVEPEENRLAAIEDWVAEEKERIRQEEERKESERIQSMLDRLDAVEAGIDFHTLKGLTDEQFEKTLSEATAAYQEKLKRIEAELEREKERFRIEQEAKALEEQRLAKEKAEQEERQRKFEQEQAEFRKEQERIRQENAAREAKIKAEEERIAAEKKAIQDAKDAEEREKVRQAELAKAREEAAEKARIEAVEKAEREAKEKEEREQREKEEAEQKLLFGEDSDRFAFLAQQIEVQFINSAVWGHMKSKKGRSAAQKVLSLLNEAHLICKENKR